MKGDIIKIAASHYGFTPTELVSKSRKRAMSKARWAIQVAMCRRGRAKAQIANWLNRDHSSIYYGIRQAEYWLERDPSFRELVDKLTEYKVTPISQEVLESATKGKEREDEYLDCD